MTTASPLEVVGAVYEAFGRGDLDALLNCVHSEAEWCQTEAGAPHPVLDIGRGIGHDAVRAYFGQVGQHMAITKFAPLVIAGSGDDVLALIELEFADPGVGKTVNVREVHHFVVRDGQIVFYEPILDTAATAVAFGN